jgi:hypothetical protein
LTSALMENADPEVFAGSLAGVIEDIGNNTPLETVTDQIAVALTGGAGGGDLPIPTDPAAVMELLSGGGDLPIPTDPAAVMELLSGGGDLPIPTDPAAAMELLSGGGDLPIPTDPAAAMELLTGEASPIGSLPGPLQTALDPLTSALNR